MFRLDGRTALVTGAGQNVGQGIALALAEHGASVVVNDLSADRAKETVRRIEAAGGRATSAVFDVTDVAAVGSAIGALDAPIDVLVNNAGVPAQGMGLVPFRQTQPRDWRGLVELNLFGVLHCTHAVLEGMCERGFGRVIVISSEAGRVGLHIGVSLYGAAKAGALGFMRHLAVEVARTGVTANAITLGMMDNVPDAVADPIRRTIPTGRLGTPRDAGAACVYLASDEASWVTGQVLPVNGGVQGG